MTFSRLSLLLLASTLSACTHAPSDKSTCAETDYYQLGLADGQSGSRREDLTEVKKSCTRAGQSVEADRYNRGYKMGLARFCDEILARSDAKAFSPHSLCIVEQVSPYVAVYNREIDKTRVEEEKKFGRAEKQKIPSDEWDMRKGVRPVDQEKASELPASF